MYHATMFIVDWPNLMNLQIFSRNNMRHNMSAAGCSKTDFLSLQVFQIRQNYCNLLAAKM